MCSDSELLTMLVVGECVGWHRETEHVSAWARHRDLFPHQPDRTRLNRRRRALRATLTALRCRVLTTLTPAHDRQWVIDSVPIPVMGFHLVPGAHNAGCWRSWGADFGRVTTKKRTGALWAVFGYKLHLLVTRGGVIRDYVRAPASAHDVTVAPELLGGHDDLVVLGDKGYISVLLADTLRTEHALHLLTPPRRNARVAEAQGRVTLWNGLRQVIETVNAQLTAQFGIGRHGAHTFGGLAARLETKLIAYTLCVLVNWQMGKAAWLQIKALAFPI